MSPPASDHAAISPEVTTASCVALLCESDRPLYMIDPNRIIVFANQAVARWTGLEAERLVGSYVEYHSEPTAPGSSARRTVLTGLCPPPDALAGRGMRATVSSVGRDGRLRHRMGHFLPLPAAGRGVAVLAVIDQNDLAPDQLSEALQQEPTADELHRTLRLFRRAQAGQYSTASVVGRSRTAGRVRAQIRAAAKSRAHVVIRGRAGSGRMHIARAIHYEASGGAENMLLPVNCGLTTEEQLRRTLEIAARGEQEQLSPTLLLQEVQRLAPELQAQVVHWIGQGKRSCQCIATIDISRGSFEREADQLMSVIGVIEIALSPLRERLEDLPLLVQVFLEEANVGNDRQVGSASREAIEQLSLYPWPGELAELREVIQQAHAKSPGHEIEAAHLPPKLQQARQAAQLAGAPIERIVLDELLASIERELIARALRQAGGNKAEAARLLGMTRPRLYRRLEQLGWLDQAEGNQP